MNSLGKGCLWIAGIAAAGAAGLVLLLGFLMALGSTMPATTTTATTDEPRAAPMAAKPENNPFRGPPPQPAKPTAPEVPVERGAAIDDDVEERLFALVSMIRAYRFRCDSVSTAYRWGYGYKVSCNQYRYNYKLSDRGGRWVVTVD